MRKLLLLLGLLASPADAAISFDDLRGLVLARDFTATDAALIAAHTEYTAAHTPDDERELYNVFALYDPAIQRFAEDWVAADPDNPRALNALGWNLYVWGWAWRGENTVNRTTTEALKGMSSRHMQAFKLFQRAAQLAPDLIPASDGMLRLTTTLGNKAVIPIELERIMTSQPNRGSLMRAMLSLAPQWGGRPEQVNLLCDRYAPKITDVPDYTPEVCRIDAVYYANFWYGDQRAAAHQLLLFMPNPILDYARYNDMMYGPSTPEEVVSGLEALKAQRDLNPEEARKLDDIRMSLARVDAMQATYPEFSTALLREVPLLQDALVKDPLNPDLLHRYVYTLDEAEAYAARPITTTEKADLIQRLHATLKAVPTAYKLWNDLAQITLGSGEFDGIARAEPYFHNAIHYSVYGNQQMANAVRPKWMRVLDQSNIMKATDISALTPEQLAQLDAIVNCPLAMQLNVLRLVCDNDGTPENQCADGYAANEVIWDRLKDRINSGACPDTFLPHFEEQYLSPKKVDF
ncbi:hypothetical protein [Cypionkella sinensis]|uniref:DUF4034 domain-containing protein n=1 Tax=Cypionkella sinensis TaxID=1756043 RepID=A0ABV7IZI2_9RHOB